MICSIVMPAFNAVQYIECAIKSVQAQTYREWELIVVDDGSSDGTTDVVRALAVSDSRIKLIELPGNSGAAYARNAGIMLATGRFIAFLDSDDVWLPEKLDVQLNFMMENKVAFSFTSYFRMDRYGNECGVIGVPSKVDYRTLLKTCVIGCLTVVYDTMLIGKVNMPSGTGREDFATWLSILKRVDYAFGINQTLAKYRVYDDQSSARKTQMAMENWRLYRNIEKLSLPTSLYYFSHYAVRGVLRKTFPELAKLIGVLD